MDTGSIDCLLNKTFHHDQLDAKFLGVYAADQMPLPLTKFPSCFVANTDPAHKPGKHWVAFYQPSRYSPLEFFNSYGFAPDYFEFDVPLETISSDVKLQSLDSHVCGHYCVLFLSLRSCMSSLRHTVLLLEKLGATARERDAHVSRIISLHRYYPSIDECNVRNGKHKQCCASFIDK